MFSNRSVFFSVCFVVFMLVQDTSDAMIMSDIECPNDHGAFIIAPCNSMTYSYCRYDSGVIDVSGGSQTTVSGSSITCNNCNPGCPEVVTAPLTCLSTLEVSYTETVNVTMASSIGTSAGSGIVQLRAALESSIGHSNARTKTFSATCGASQLPVCTKATYELELNITENIQKKIEHTYEWVCTLYHNSSICSIPSVHTGPYPIESKVDGGKTISTATGSSYGTAQCKTKDYSSDCRSSTM